MRTKLGAFIKALLWGLLVILFPVAGGVAAGVAGLETAPALYLQSGFMAASLVIPLIAVLRGKWKPGEIGLRRFDAAGARRALYFIPLLLIYIPVTLAGFYIRSANYVLGCFLLYLLVGVAEEVYFRGIVPLYLGRAFSRRGVIILSTLIFGTGHLATAFAGGGALETALTVLNAFIFGWLAIEVTLLSGNIAVSVLIHFLFDFETKLIAMSGVELALAEGVRGTVMFLLALWLALVIRKAGRAPAEPDAETEKRRRRKRKSLVIYLIIFLFVAGAALTGLMLYGRAQAKKLPALSFEDCLAYTLAGSADGRITIGVIKDGEASYRVYGEDGRELPQTPYTYEIGSLTKTFTAALIQRAVAEGRLSLDGTLDRYIDLPADKTYPTVAELLTHTSGYRGYYLEAPTIGNFFKGRNDFYGISGEMIAEKLRTLDMRKSDYPFKYSNFGYAALSLVLESVYGEDYASLVNGFTAELGLGVTHISSESARAAGGWDWRGDDAYLAAGALVSNIEDMLRYAQLQLDGQFDECHRPLKAITTASADNRALGINMDSIGMAWISDETNGIVWHNGGTGAYNCYLGFKPESGVAVVVLSNLAPSYRIPATVLGVKLLTENE